ncbi:MAG: hypothetical protein AB1420_11220 [Bacillota bacterium]
MTAKLEVIKNKLLDKSKDGKITCAQARSLAEELGIEYDEVGKAADELKIKIYQCQLGCF